MVCVKQRSLMISDLFISINFHTSRLLITRTTCMILFSCFLGDGKFIMTVAIHHTADNLRPATMHASTVISCSSLVITA